MKQKTMYELWGEVLVRYLAHIHIQPHIGICAIISGIEGLENQALLKIDLNTNKPSLSVNRKFFYNPDYTGGTWWWTKNMEGRHQRQLFIQYMMDLHLKRQINESKKSIDV